MFNNDESQSLSSYNELNTALQAAEQRRTAQRERDGRFLSALKDLGLVDQSLEWSKRSTVTRSELQQSYRDNAHRIPEGQDGFFTTLLKQNGFLDWRDRYESFGTYVQEEYSAAHLMTTTDEDGRNIAAFSIFQENTNGELALTHRAEFIDETNLASAQENGVEIEELSSDEENIEASHIQFVSR